jgi:hypothetical protein
MMFRALGIFLLLPLGSAVAQLNSVFEADMLGRSGYKFLFLFFEPWSRVLSEIAAAIAWEEFASFTVKFIFLIVHRTIEMDGELCAKINISIPGGRLFELSFGFVVLGLLWFLHSSCLFVLFVLDKTLNGRLATITGSVSNYWFN